VKRDAFAAKVRHMAEIAFDDQCVGANPCYPLVADLERLFWESYDGTTQQPDAPTGAAKLEIHVEPTDTEKTTPA
jgi:hypothetical protein